MMRSSFYVLLLIIISLLVSCDNKQVFDNYKTVDNSWHKDSVISFAVNKLDTIKPYNLFFNLRANKNYKYNNIFLIAEINFPHGKTVKDTLEYRMADADGRLLGTGFTDLKESKLWYKENFVFNENDKYSIRIQHAMRENGKVKGVEFLDGISDVGFRIEKVEN